MNCGPPCPSLVLEHPDFPPSPVLSATSMDLSFPGLSVLTLLLVVAMVVEVVLTMEEVVGFMVGQVFLFITGSLLKLT